MGLDIGTILYIEMNVVCIIFLFLVLFKLKGNTFSTRIFKVIVICNCVLFLADSLWAIADSEWNGWGPIGDKLAYLFYFLVSAPASYFWFLYSEITLSKKLDKKFVLIASLPITIYLILVFISFQTGWLYYVGEDGIFHSGPVYWLAILFTYGYVVAGSLRALYASKHVNNYMLKKKFLTIAFYCVPVLFFGTLQELSFDIPFMCVGNTMAIFYFFFSMQEQEISIDSLTDINNYNKFRSYLSECISRFDGKDNLYLVMMDLNKFKSINDTYGHVEGDNALIKTADALKNCIKGRDYFVARYGGDEFVAICELSSNDSIDDFCQMIRREIGRQNDACPYLLEISLGYAKYSKDIPTDDDFIKLADSKLYEDKEKSRRR